MLTASPGSVLFNFLRRPGNAPPLRVSDALALHSALSEPTEWEAWLKLLFN